MLKALKEQGKSEAKSPRKINYAPSLDENEYSDVEKPWKKQETSKLEPLQTWTIWCKKSIRHEIQACHPRRK